MGYRFDFLRPDHEYYAAWSEYRRRRRIKWIALLSFFPATIVAALLLVPLSLVLESDIPVATAGLIVGIVAFGAAVVTHGRQMYWQCPKCQRPFFLEMIFYAPFDDACRHCKLPLYVPCDPTKQEWERA
ncbi:MAG: hypothetical protein SGJ19_27975 [Planctomycetia bacterium]|nr:hypothetical protein [Planctomycetia bacterium]